MTTPHYLGIDVGGTVAKAAVFDQRGKLVSLASVAMRDQHPRAGWTERDPQQMWAAAAGAVRQALQSEATGADRIAAVCCTGHGNGLYAVNAQGLPAMPGIVSSDNRAGAMCREIEARDDHADLVAAFGQRFRACSMPVLLSWLDRHMPEVQNHVAHLLLCKDYLRLRLTGEAASEISDLSGCGILNFRAREYDAELLDRMGLQHWYGKLPPMLRSSDVAGHVTAEAATVTGLRVGTPVVAGMMDLDAVTLASGVQDSGQVAVCGGTWSINLVLAGHPCEGHHPLLQTWHRDGALCVVCEGSPTSATNLAWLLDTAMGHAMPSFEQVNAGVANLAASDSHLVYLPYIHGEDGAAKACFIGLDSATTQAHLWRAVFEGVAFEHARHIEDVIALSGASPTSLRLSGGVSQSEVWTQMFADVTGMRVEVAQGQELGALGCAICAAVALGHQADYGQAVRAMTTVLRTLHPQIEAHGVYRAKRRQFDRVSAALAPVWPDFAASR